MYSVKTFEHGTQKIWACDFWAWMFIKLLFTEKKRDYYSVKWLILFPTKIWASCKIEQFIKQNAFWCANSWQNTCLFQRHTKPNDRPEVCACVWMCQHERIHAQDKHNERKRSTIRTIKQFIAWDSMICVEKTKSLQIISSTGTQTKLMWIFRIWKIEPKQFTRFVVVLMWVEECKGPRTIERAPTKRTQSDEDYCLCCV